jgi:glycosyltransferase involved in cell wall biosynthesis
MHEHVVSSTRAFPAARFSVVICAFSEERWSTLADAIRSAVAQSHRPLDVLVVIDHNRRLLRRAREAFGAPVRVLANEEGRGLSGARNTGIRHAAGDFIAFLDDDAAAESTWLAELARAYDDPAVIGAGGVALPRWEARPPRWLPPEFLWVVGCSYRGQPRTVAPVRNPIGANMSFRREAFARAGLFTHGIGRIGSTPLGCEETELAIRVVNRCPGRVVVHVPHARVSHRVTGQRGTWAYFRARCWAEGLSKAMVTEAAGRTDALTTERDYVARTLPAGVLDGLRAVVRGDLHGAARAAAIIAGLSLTAAGYARGVLATSRRRRPRIVLARGSDA